MPIHSSYGGRVVDWIPATAMKHRPKAKELLRQFRTHYKKDLTGSVAYLFSERARWSAYDALRPNIAL